MVQGTDGELNGVRLRMSGRWEGWKADGKGLSLRT